MGAGDLPDGPVVGETTSPAPENVALAGAPNVCGCGVGPALHASLLAQGGGDAAGTGGQGALLLQT